MKQSVSEFGTAVQSSSSCHPSNLRHLSCLGSQTHSPLPPLAAVANSRCCRACCSAVLLSDADARQGLAARHHDQFARRQKGEHARWISLIGRRTWKEGAEPRASRRGRRFAATFLAALRFRSCCSRVRLFCGCVCPWWRCRLVDAVASVVLDTRQHLRKTTLASNQTIMRPCNLRKDDARSCRRR